MRFSLSFATKPIDLESCDQKTPLASSVPGSSRAAKESMGRTHSVRLGAPFFWAVKASRRPSGEIAEPKKGLVNSLYGGACKENRSGSGALSAGCRHNVHAASAAAIVAAAVAAIHKIG